MWHSNVSISIFRTIFFSTLEMLMRFTELHNWNHKSKKIQQESNLLE